MGTPHELGKPLNISTSYTTDPDEALAALQTDAVTTGRLPHAVRRSLDDLPPEANLDPPDGVEIGTARDDHKLVRLSAGDGWLALSIRENDGNASLTVTAATPELAAKVVQDVLGEIPEVDHGPDRVPMGFWYHSTDSGAHRSVRPITALSWEEIRGNYSAPAAGAFERLMSHQPGSSSGRLILLHGPPGTGKTTALRTLAREWRSWCQVDNVLDPDELFLRTGYLMEVTLGEEAENKGRWRLLLLEDCDELIRGEAKAASGQALSRLLNLTDGLLGHGRDVIVAITTNEDLARLHPAVARPGRCLAQIEVGPLGGEETARWLTANGMPDDAVTAPATLAELIAVRDGQGLDGERTAHSPGMYL
ncbi:DUF5925 domain-containing protein [Nonomuraea sp. NPDC050663]|uniref:DUF5925 domain-containing protein n=1 Tax=Nonomuraea sp. NPDC050663 TaxID=3364370 RepID=UPI0037A17309